MMSHWIYTLGSKACMVTDMVAARVWPQPQCNVEETWNMGYVVVGLFVILTVFSLYRRMHAWHKYYRS